MVMRSYIVAAVAALPLLAPEAWGGFRLALSDVALGVIATTEQPLSARNPAGVWAVALALAWFALAYWRRNVTLWEAALVLVGGAAALARLGNAWLYAAAIVPPLGRQIALARPRSALLGALAACSVVVALATLVSTRPPELPTAARDAAIAATQQGTVLADWRWAPELQRQLGSGRRVLGAGGLGSESGDFWVDYVRVLEGHERWPETLSRMHVDLVVVDPRQAPIADLVRASAQWRVTYDAHNVLVAVRSAP